jgi:hypothetical protein
MTDNIRTNFCPGCKTLADENAALKASVKALEGALIQHNDCLRSAAQIAGRDGKDTNWLSFRGRVHYTLAEYHDLTNECRAKGSPHAE